ncbi:peptide ABC transporter substrate-binding protein [Testudinibacter sp. P80/BLE/0925]|uniref:peptide ABC transporter substrate-binding protein n=1 Tax=Testudinibacter sp. TW-1 TaxID=3417757 RepID=UPI003D3674EB
MKTFSLIGRFKRSPLKCGLRYALFLLCFASLGGCDWWARLTGGQPEDVAPKTEPSLDENRQLLKRGLYLPAFNLSPPQPYDELQLPLWQDLYEGLVRIDKHGKLQPAAAESWQRQDDKIWTFHLRPDLRWSNGERLTAQDFVQSWYALAVQGADNPLSGYLRFMALENVEAVLKKEVGVEMLGIKALDEKTLQLTLSQAVPYLPQMLAHIALSPLYQGEDNGTLVTNGAYHVLYSGEKALLLEKNPFYWDTKNVAFRNVSYSALAAENTDDQAELAALDLFPQVANNADLSRGSSHMRSIRLPSLCNYYYEFNFRHPQLKQSAVRKALAGMISLPEIVNTLPGSRANAKFLPRQMQDQENTDGWSPIIVEQLLAQAGVNSQNPLRLRLGYDQQGIHPQIAEKLIRMLSQSDLIQIQAEALTRQQLLERRANGDFDLIRSGWCADYHDPSAFFSILHSQSGNNKMAFADPQVDEWLQKSVESAVTEAERQQLYQQLETFINQEQLVLPLFQYYDRYWIKTDLAGYETGNSVIYSQDLYRRVGK